MAQIRLRRALLSLLSDPGGTQVEIPSLAAMSSSFSHERTFVRFAGDTYPTAFRGDGLDQAYALTCQYARKRHEQLADLLELLRDVAPAAPDSRLLLRTHGGDVPGLNTAAVGEVDGEVVPSWAPAVVSVQFTFRVVQYDGPL